MDDRGAAPLQSHILHEIDESNSFNWQHLSAEDLFSTIWTAESQIQSRVLYPSTWPEEVALPRFPDCTPLSCPTTDLTTSDDQTCDQYHKDLIKKKKIIARKHRKPNAFGERAIFARDFHKLHDLVHVDPDALILWPEWMLTETGFQGFRILGRLPVVFHLGGISKRNRQIVMDIINENTNEIVYGPKLADTLEGAITFNRETCVA